MVAEVLGKSDACCVKVKKMKMTEMEYVSDLWVVGDKEQWSEKKWGKNYYPSSPEDSDEFFQRDLWTRDLSLSNLKLTQLDHMTGGTNLFYRRQQWILSGGYLHKIFILSDNFLVGGDQLTGGTILRREKLVLQKTATNSFKGNLCTRDLFWIGGDSWEDHLTAWDTTWHWILPGGSMPLRKRLFWGITLVN